MSAVSFFDKASLFVSGLGQAFQRQHPVVKVGFAVAAVAVVAFLSLRSQPKPEAASVIPPISSPLLPVSDHLKKPTETVAFDKKLQAWVAENPAEKEGREKAALIIQTHYLRPLADGKVDLSNLNISTLPECFFEVAGVKSLNLCNNRFVSVPKGIEKFKELEALNLMDNSNLAEFGVTLSKLKILDIRHTQLGILSINIPSGCQVFANK